MDDEHDDQEVVHDCILQAVSGKLHLFDCYGYARWDFVSGPKIECLWRSYDEDRASALEDIRPLVYMLLCPEVARNMSTILQQDEFDARSIDDACTSETQIQALAVNLRRDCKRKFLQNQAYQKTATCIVFPCADIVSRRSAVGCFFALSSVETLNFCLDAHGLVCNLLANVAEVFLNVHLSISNDLQKPPHALRTMAAAITRSSSSTAGGLQNHYKHTISNGRKYSHIDNLIRNMHLVTSALYQQSFMQPNMGDIFRRHWTILTNIFDTTFLATAVTAFLLNGCRAIIVGKHTNPTQLLAHVMLLFSTKNSTSAHSFLKPFVNVFSFDDTRKSIAELDWHEYGANSVAIQTFESPFHVARINHSNATVLIVNVDKGRIIYIPSDAVQQEQQQQHNSRMRHSTSNNNALQRNVKRGLNNIHQHFNADANVIAAGDFNVDTTTIVADSAPHERSSMRRNIYTIMDQFHEKAAALPVRRYQFYSTRVFELCDKLHQLSADEMDSDLLNGLVMPFKFFVDDLAAQLEHSSVQAKKYTASSLSSIQQCATAVSNTNGDAANSRTVVDAEAAVAQSWAKVALCELLGKLDEYDAFDVAFALGLAESRRPGVVEAFRPLVPHIVNKLL